MQRKITEQDQGADICPPKAGRTFEGAAENPEILMDQGGLAVPSKTSHDASTRNDSETRRVDTGNRRGIGSTSVRKARPEGFTYFVQAGAQIKIGFTNNFRRRLTGIRSKVKKPLTVLLVVPSDMAGEYDTHQLFDHLRMRRDWFRADRELLDFIDGLRADLEAQKAGLAKPEPRRISVIETLARDLQAKIHTMPKAARPFAYNLIQQTQALSGDCDDRQMQALQRSMKQQMTLLEQALLA